MQTLNWPWRRGVLRFTLLVSVALLTACGGGGGGSDDDDEDLPPDAISQRLSVQDATFVEEAPPAPSADPEAPKLDTDEAPVQVVESDSQVDLEVTVDAVDGVSALLLRVEEANSYFIVENPETEEEDESSSVLVPRAKAKLLFRATLSLLIPADFNVSEFCVDVAAIDLSGRVSNYHRICFQLPEYDPEVTSKPVANAGGAQAAYSGDTVELDGRDSAVPPGTPSSYAWTQVSGPSVAILQASEPLAAFVAPAVSSGSATLVFQLQVSAGGRTSTSTTRVTVYPGAPEPPDNYQVSFSPAAASAIEGGGTSVTVSLSAASNSTVIVPFTLAGTATPDDYSLPASPVNIPAGSTSAQISISAVDDAADEPDETLVINMGTPTGATAGETTAVTVTLVDNDEPPPAGSLSGRVTNAVDAAGIAGVTVSAGGVSAVTAADGSYMLAGVPTADRIVVSFDREGFVPQTRLTEELTEAGAQVLVNVPMLPYGVVQAFDPSAAQSITVAGSTAQVDLPANALRRADGSAPAGNVIARVTRISPADNVEVMPGDYSADLGDGTTGTIESFGALDVSFVDAEGMPVDLAGNTSSRLRIPVSTRSEELPATVPLFHFNRTSGLWEQEGTATLQGTAPDRYYEGDVAHFSTWNADALYESVTVSGCVQDRDGQRVTGATVKAEGKTYSGRASTVTDAEGNFTVPVKPESEVFLYATKGSEASNSPTVAVDAANITLSECLTFTETAMSIKLTWGAAPADLDSHTLGANSSDHIYYLNMGSLAELPYIALDVDDTTGFGPEVTTVARLARNRTYSFFVHNYSHTYSPGQTDSPARVELVYRGQQSVFAPPAGETPDTTYWHVFNFVTDASCNASIVPVQQFLSVAPSNANIGNDAEFCD